MKCKDCEFYGPVAKWCYQLGTPVCEPEKELECSWFIKKEDTK